MTPSPSPSAGERDDACPAAFPCCSPRGSRSGSSTCDDYWTGEGAGQRAIWVTMADNWRKRFPESLAAPTRVVFLDHRTRDDVRESIGAIGVDGCHCGWVVAFAHHNRAERLFHTELAVVREDDGGFAALVGACETIARRPTLAVDVPIGLPETGHFRACDREARAVLGAKRDCVFRVWGAQSRFRRRSCIRG